MELNVGAKNKNVTETKVSEETNENVNNITPSNEEIIAQDNKENVIQSNKENENDYRVHNEDKEIYLNKPYEDKRTITISLVNNYSYYRQVNDKVMDERNEFIGSCVRSSRALSSNKNEMNAYFPNLIGVSPSNENYITRVKEYLNNIQVKVDKLGLKINIGFHYNHYRDYLNFKKREDNINAKFDTVDKTNTKLLKEALETKIKELNSLEAEKYEYGYPDNVADYILYRHCLLYKDIAKDISIINSDKSIRFYFKDDAKEAKRQESNRIELNKAKRNYIILADNPKMFENVYIQYCVLKKIAIIPALAESELIKQNNLDKFSMEEPAKFNKICSDKNLEIKSLIEKLISNGVLTRHPYSQNIISSDGDYIGANMKEAVAWFMSPSNADIIDAYKNKLKFV